MGLLEKLFISLSFGFCKISPNCWYLLLESKKVFFLQVFHNSSFLLEKLSTHLTMHCLKCLFHIINHIDLVGTVTFVERISWQNCTPENIGNKGTCFFQFLVGDFNILDRFNKIQNIKYWPVFPVVPLLRRIPKALGPEDWTKLS